MIRSALCAAAFSLYAVSALAQVTSQHGPTGPESMKGWLDVNFVGARASQDQQTYTYSFTRFLEPAAAAAIYPKLPTATGGEIVGGFRIGQFGVGVRFTPINYESTAGLGVSIPHPTIFNDPASAGGVSGTLKREDRAVDVSAIYFPPVPEPWRIRLFAGPTFFSVTQEMVGIINYNQVYNAFGLNVITVTGATTQDVSGSTVGLHGGADVAYFFARHVGVGGVITFNRGTVKIDKEPLTGQSADLKVGQTLFGAGLRLRF